MLNADWVSADQAVFGRSPREIACLSLDGPTDVRLAQNIPASEVRLSAVSVRSMPLALIREEMAKSKLQRLMQLKDAYEEADLR